MLLASIDTIRSELTFDDIPDIEDIIVGALKSAGRVIASRLNTEFDYANRVDTFMVNPNRPLSIPMEQMPSNRATTPATVGTGVWAGSPLYTTQFSLNHGFLVSDSLTDLTVKSATMIANFGDSTTEADLRNFEGDDLDHTFTSLEDGRVYVQQIDVRGLFVRIGYISGFTVASDGQYEGVPSWLERAAIIQAEIMMDRNSVIRRPEGAEGQIEVLLGEYRQIIDQHLRYHPGAVHPLNR